MDIQVSKIESGKSAGPGRSYINNKLFTASSEKERKICSSGSRAPGGAMPAAMAIALVIPGVVEGLGELLLALMSALAGAVGAVIKVIMMITGKKIWHQRIQSKKIRSRKTVVLVRKMCQRQLRKIKLVKNP